MRKTIVKLAVAILALLVLANCPVSAKSVSFQQAPDDASVELARAQENAKAAEKNYQTVKRLSEYGSASQRRLRRAELEKNLSTWKLSTLLNPELREKNLLLKARSILQFRDAELRVIRGLFNHGSASELSFRRAVAARDIAKSNLDAIESTTETQRKLKLIQMARSKHEIAQREFSIAQRLFESGSISQQTFDRATSNLRIALTELKASKKSLGATAVQVRQ